MLLALLVVAGLPLADKGLIEALTAVDAPPGAWAEYLVRTKGREDVRVRVTALAAERPELHWVELAMAAEGGIASAARLLVRRDGPVARIERILVMLAGQQPIEIPVPRHSTARAMPSTRAGTASRTQSVELLASGTAGGRSVFPRGWSQGNGSESAK